MKRLFLLVLILVSFVLLAGCAMPLEQAVDKSGNVKDIPSAAKRGDEAEEASLGKKELPATEKQGVTRVESYIAVFDLETVGKVDKDISRPLTESIRLEIGKTGKYELIDRSNMDKVFKEQQFQQSGCVSGECVVEAGQLLGVGKIITGTVSLLGSTYYLSLSLINVEKGKIEASSEDECKCEVDELIKSSKRLVKRLLEEESPINEQSPQPIAPSGKRKR